MKWILISGLGADHRLFVNFLDLLPDHQILDFVMPHQKETIEQYAERLFTQVNIEGPVVLAGTSFGGMLASVMCQQIKPQALVLMCSALCPEALNTGTRVFEWMSRSFPDVIAQWIRGLGRNAARWLEPLEPPQLEVFAEMAGAAPLELVRRGARMIMEWQLTPEVTCPIYHLHGDKDLLIPIRKVQPTQVVKGAGHVLNLSHPEQVRDFILQVQQGLQKQLIDNP